MAYPQPPRVVFPTIQGNGLYLILDSYGTITTSSDNINWNIPTQPFTSLDAHWYYNGVIFGEGLFVAYGNHIVIAGSALPGSSWASVINKGGNWISAAFTSDNQWFLIDNEGRTATSKDSYPANWTVTSATTVLPPTFDSDSLPIW